MSSLNDVRPLAERLRPANIADFVGQGHLFESGQPLQRMAQGGRLASFILWGPPGSGKTTLARLLAAREGIAFEQAPATSSGLALFREIFARAGERQQEKGEATLLFIDEIHRLTRVQQDALLAVIEEGRLFLVGATTDNPSFTLSPALLSRADVFVLHRLDVDALEAILSRAEKVQGRALPLTPEARKALLAMSDGDGRFLLNLAEQLFEGEAGENLDEAGLAKQLRRRAPLYDRAADQHYNLISALHKSVRGSDPDAALYWLERMLLAGEDPLYITRRLIRMASEDIGMADPQGLTQALAAQQAYQSLGAPEGLLAVAQAVVYLASAPKSIALYKAAGAAKQFARKHGSLDPPKHILNAPTKLMKNLGYGKDYQYDPATKEGFSGQNYFPDELAREKFYHPDKIGFEREIIKRLDWWEKLRRQKQTEKK